MFLYKKVVGCVIILVLLVVIILSTYFFWPRKIEIQTDMSQNEDNEKNTGSIQGSATNSQNNNQKHINFSGDFIFTLLIFILLLIQSISQSIIFIRSTTRNIGNSMTKDTEDQSTPDSALQQMQGHYSHPPTQNQFSHSYQAPSSSSLPSPPQTPGHAYYTINENSRYPYAPVQSQISIDCQTDMKPKEAEPDYKELYNRLKIRSSAAGLDV